MDIILLIRHGRLQAMVDVDDSAETPNFATGGTTTEHEIGDLLLALDKRHHPNRKSGFNLNAR